MLALRVSGCFSYASSAAGQAESSSRYSFIAFASVTCDSPLMLQHLLGFVFCFEASGCCLSLHAGLGAAAAASVRPCTGMLYMQALVNAVPCAVTLCLTLSACMGRAQALVCGNAAMWPSLTM